MYITKSLFYSPISQNRNNSIGFKGYFKSTFDKRSKKPLSDIMKLWKLIIQDYEISQFFVAGSKKDFDKFILEFKKELGIIGETVEIPLEDLPFPSITENLKKAKEKILSQPGQTVLIVVRNFEDKFKVSSDTFEGIIKEANKREFFRAAHDYNQTVSEKTLFPNENSIQEIFKDKKLVIITHIGDSQGNTAYQEAKKSACGSDFKDGLIEI